MKKAMALAMTVSMLPGCCVVGMTVGGSNAAERNARRNEERARKLERGERLGPDDQDESQGGAALKGFVIGGVLDLVALAALSSLARQPLLPD